MTCICGHDHSTHDDIGACVAIVDVSIFVNGYGEPVCPCNEFMERRDA